MTWFEVLLGALIYQFALYVCLRLAHRVFTLGELGLVCFGGTALLMEFGNVNIARVRTPRKLKPRPLIRFSYGHSRLPS